MAIPVRIFHFYLYSVVLIFNFEFLIMFIHRPRRNRKSQIVRNLVQEHSLHVNDFIYPLFLTDGKNKKTRINSMPGIFRFSGDLLLKEIESCMKLGIKSFALFPHIDEKLKHKTATEHRN